MATHSSILAWRVAMDRGDWQATIHGLQRVGHNWVITVFGDSLVAQMVKNLLPVVTSKVNHIQIRISHQVSELNCFVNELWLSGKDSICLMTMESYKDWNKFGGYAIDSNSPSKEDMHACSVMSNSFATPWTVVHQAPLSMEFSRQEYWSGLPFPSPPYMLYSIVSTMWVISSSVHGSKISS